LSLQEALRQEASNRRIIPPTEKIVDVWREASERSLLVLIHGASA
jgi:hypothetical protein